MNYIKTTLISALVLTSSLLASAANAALILDLTPSSQNTATGGSVDLDLMISGLGDGVPDSLSLFSLEILFDDSRLSLTSYTLSDNLGNIGSEALDFSFGDIGGGVIDLYNESLLLPGELDALQSDSFSLATLSFDVDDLALGESTIVSVGTVYSLADSFASDLTLDLSTNDAVLRNPTTVPEPGTVALFAMSFGMLLLRRKS